MERILHLSDFAGIEPFSSSFARMGDNYILSHVNVPEDNDDVDDYVNRPNVVTNRSMRLNGFLLVLARKGGLEMQINVESHSISQGDMFIVSPGSLVNFTKVDRPSEFDLLFIATAFMHSINIDLNSIDFRSIIKRRSPVMRLNDREADIIRRYFTLFDLNAESNPNDVFAKQIARSLIATLVYEIFRFSFDHLGLEDSQSATERSARPLNYVHAFMQLLHLNYTRERSMNFYAEKLCISPKYLSMITKEATGKTATEWINEFVIVEAKNQLRFSGKSIQQVAYALNFSSQSSFGKFFKRVTGQSPSEYQKN